MVRLGRVVRRRVLGLVLVLHVEDIRDHQMEAVARGRGSRDLGGRVLVVVVRRSRLGEEGGRIGPAAGDSSPVEGGCRNQAVAGDRGVDRGSPAAEDGRTVLALLVSWILL